MEDDGVSFLVQSFYRGQLTSCSQIRTHTLQMLNRKNQSLKDIVKTLEVYHDNVDDDTDAVGEELTRKEILQGLISSLSEPA